MRKPWGCHEGGTWGFDRRENGLSPGGVDSYMSYGLSWANASNTPFRLFKHYIHEGGVSTPLIARWPGQIPNKGSLRHDVCHIVDIMATCCDLSGAAYPERFHDQTITPLEGKTLLPLLRGEKREDHESLSWEHFGNKGIRKGSWKLVSVKKGNWELYNLVKDRTETNNLVRERQDKAEELKKDYEDWAKRIGV